jgi:hypothetical protein
VALLYYFAIKQYFHGKKNKQPFTTVVKGLFIVKWFYRQEIPAIHIWKI